MPTIRTPDGRRLRVPDGATPEQITAVLQSQGYDLGAAPRQIEHVGGEAGNPTDDMSAFDRARAGFGKAFADTGRGIKQFATERVRDIAGGDAFGIMPEGMGGHNAVTDWADRSLASQQAVIDESRQNDAALMDTTAGFLGNVGGQVAQTVAVPVGGAATLTGKLGVAALQGGAYAGAQPTATGESRALNAGLGAGLSAGGQGIASGLGRLAQGAKNRLPEAVQQSIELARRAGIPLNVAQVTESAPIKAAQAVTKWLPFSGAGKAARNQQEAWNSALGRSMGLEGAAYLTDDVMRAARKKIGGVFEDVYSRNDVPLTPDAVRKLVSVENEWASRLTSDESAVVRRQLDKILENADEGLLTGQKYQAVRSLLQKAEGTDKVGSAVKELRKTLDNVAAEAVGPDDAAALTKSRGQWANMRVIEDALKQMGEAGKGGAAGNVKPSSLWPLIRKGSTKEMRELAKIGQNVLRDGLPDSGTAQRSLYTSALAGGSALGGLLPLFLKGAAGGAVAGRALNSNTASKLLQQGRPTSALAQLAQQTLPRALPTAAPNLAGLTIAGGRVATPEEIAADEEIVRRFRQGR
jgi:hypothetical protein